MEDQRVYGGISAEQRHDDRRLRLIEATFELLGTAGTRGLTVRKVSTLAGVAPRHLYEAFADLDDLRRGAFDTAAEEVAANVLTSIAAASDDPRSRLVAVIDALSVFTEQEPQKARLLLTDSFGDPSLLTRRLEMTKVFAEAFSFYVAEFLAGFEVPQRAIDLAARFLVGAAAETFTGWMEGTLDYEREQLVADTVDLFLGTIDSLKLLVG